MYLIYFIFSLLISISRLSLAHLPTGRKRNLLRPRGVGQEMGEEMAPSVLAAPPPLSPKTDGFGAEAKTNVSAKAWRKRRGAAAPNRRETMLFGISYVSNQDFMPCS